MSRTNLPLLHGPKRRSVLKHIAGAAVWVAAGGCSTLTTPSSASAPAKQPSVIQARNLRLVQNWDFRDRITTHQQLREAFYTRYIYNDGKLDKLNDEWQRYRDNDNHVFEDGRLALVARAPAGLAKGTLESGMLRSKWSGQYGYFECRMKVPAGQGLWPAFWLNPQDQIWPPEIDVVEIVNNGRDTTRNSFHFVHAGVRGQKVPATFSLLDKWGSYRPGFDYKDDFHTFAVDWSPDYVRHYVDDVLVVDRPFRWTHKDGADAGTAHVLLNLAVGGRWPGAPKDPGIFPAKLLVEFIRVWQ